MEAQTDNTLEAHPAKDSPETSFVAEPRRHANRVSLLMRLWQESGCDRQGSSHVRAFVRNLQSGEEQYLDGMDNVLGFVSASCAAGRPADETPGNDL